MSPSTTPQESTLDVVGDEEGRTESNDLGSVSVLHSFAEQTMVHEGVGVEHAPPVTADAYELYRRFPDYCDVFVKA